MKVDFTDYKAVLQRGIDQKKNIEEAVDKVVKKVLKMCFW